MEQIYNSKANRLRFVHCDNLFDTREEAIKYVEGGLISIERPALYAEPMVLKYGDASNPDIILAIGSVGDGETQSLENKVFYIDFAELSREVDALSESVKNAEDVFLSGGYYDKETESIVLELNNGETIYVDVLDLIEEWGVSDPSLSPIVLNKIHVGYEDIAPQNFGTHVNAKSNAMWRDILSADVRISDDETNILEKVNTFDGQALFVKGTADNIISKYKGEEITVQDSIDKLDSAVELAFSELATIDATEVSLVDDALVFNGLKNVNEALFKLDENIKQVKEDAKSFEIIKVTDENEINNNTELEENVREVYKLVDEEGVMCGDYIKVYKDSALQSVVLEDQELIFTYILTNGDKSVVKVDVSKFLAESEFADGLQVNDSVVSIKICEGSEGFLTVGKDGLKLTGIQLAIDNAVKIETDRALRAEEELNFVLENANETLTDAIKTEKNRAIAKEDEIHDALVENVNILTKAIEEEKLRAEDVENQVYAQLIAESTRAQEAETKLFEDAKSYADEKVGSITVDRVAEDGKYITAITQTNGLVSVELDTIKASEVFVNNEDKSLNGENVEAVLLDLVEQIKAGNDKAESLNTAMDERLVKIESFFVNQNSGEDIIDTLIEIQGYINDDMLVSDNVKQNTEDIANLQTKTDDVLNEAKTYADSLVDAVPSYEIKTITEGLGTNIKEAYRLYDSTGKECGAQINVYKDSSLKEVVLVDQKLVFTYNLADGTQTSLTVDTSKFLAESEFKDGLAVNGDGVVSVKLASGSESFLTVTENGIALNGVQDAIDEAVVNGEVNTLSKLIGGADAPMTVTVENGEDGKKVITAHLAISTSDENVLTAGDAGLFVSKYVNSFLGEYRGKTDSLQNLLGTIEQEIDVAMESGGVADEIEDEIAALKGDVRDLKDAIADLEGGGSTDSGETNKRVDELDTKVGELDTKVGELDVKVGELETENAQLKETVNILSQTVSDLISRLEAIEAITIADFGTYEYDNTVDSGSTENSGTTEGGDEVVDTPTDDNQTDETPME